jgi:spore germination protein GerM
MSRRIIIFSAIAVLAIAGSWWLVRTVIHRRSTATNAAATTPAASTPVAGTVGAAARKITTTLYYVSEDGMNLVGVQREVPYGETVIDQAREIVTAQLTPAPEPFASALPPSTTLRSLYLTERGDAFVDLSDDARTKHTGGALDELFAVYAIVNALTTNLPAITRVQILIDGKEVDTLAGHVDLRHPLQKNLKWVKTEKGET